MRLDCTPVTLVRAYPEDSAKQFDFGRIPCAKDTSLGKRSRKHGRRYFGVKAVPGLLSEILVAIFLLRSAKPAT